MDFYPMEIIKIPLVSKVEVESYFDHLLKYFNLFPEKLEIQMVLDEIKKYKDFSVKFKFKYLIVLFEELEEAIIHNDSEEIQSLVKDILFCIDKRKDHIVYE